MKTIKYARQAFHKGDLVRLSPEYWNQWLGHEPAPRERHPAEYAIILGSYRDQYGGGPDQRHCYSVLLLNEDGTVNYEMSWVADERVEYLVEARCDDQLRFIDAYEEEQWEADEEYYD